MNTRRHKDVEVAVSVRRAVMSDIPILAEMNCCLIEDEGSRNPMSLHQLERRMEQWLLEEWSGVVILMDSTIVGYLLYREWPDEYFPDQTVIYVRQLFIRAAYRRQGIGTVAFNRIAEQFFPRLARVTVEVLSTNGTAQGFWQKLGFKPYSVMLHGERDEGR